LLPEKIDTTLAVVSTLHHHYLALIHVFP